MNGFNERGSITLFDPGYGVGNPNISWMDVYNYYDEMCREADDDTYDALRSWVKENLPVSKWTLRTKGQYCSDWGESMATKNKKTGPPDEKNCVKQVWDYCIDNILNKIDPKKYPNKPEEPSLTCSIVGIMGLAVVVVAIGFILVYSFEFLVIAKWIVSTLLSVLKGGAVYTSGFVSRVGVDIVQSEGTLVTLVKYALDMFFDLVTFIVDWTDVAPGLLYLNVVTLFALGISIVFKDTEILIDRFEGTIYSEVFKICNWPFKFIMSAVEDLVGGKDLIYYLVKFFVLPFEGGTLILSLLIGTIIFILEQFLAVIKEAVEDEPLPPVVSKEDYLKRVKK